MIDATKPLLGRSSADLRQAWLGEASDRLEPWTWVVITNVLFHPTPPLALADLPSASEPEESKWV